MLISSPYERPEGQGHCGHLMAGGVGWGGEFQSWPVSGHGKTIKLAPPDLPLLVVV